MTTVPLTQEQIMEIVHRAFPDALVMRSEHVARDDTADCYSLELDNLLEATLKVYIEASWNSEHPEHSKGKEARLLRMMTSETGVPVPRVLYSADHLPDEGQDDPQAHAWVLLSRLPGNPLSEIVDALDDWESESLGYEMGRYLAHIHQVPLDRFGEVFIDGVHDHVREKGYVLSQASDWLAGCAAEGLLADPVIHEVHDRLENTDLLDRRQACLIHGAFRTRSIVVEQGMAGYHVTGIQDLAHAQGGSPEQDMAILFAQDLAHTPAMQKGFLDGYAESGELGARFWDRLALYQGFVSLGLLLQARQRHLPQQEQLYSSLVSEYLDRTRE